MFVDFSGQTLAVTDPVTGWKSGPEISVAMPWAPNSTFEREANFQAMRDWIILHVQTFEFFRRVPKFVIPDNLKSSFTHLSE